MNGEIRIAEGFAGIGGLRLGFEQASPRYKIVWANDWIHGSQKWDEATHRWKGPQNQSGKIYTKHWNDGSYHDQNVCEVNPDDIPEIDGYIGGFPCQPFSLAGERAGFSDFRGTLFYEIARILKAKRPKFFLLENVKGLLSAQNGFCFLAILDKLDELGYDVEWKVLNTKNWLPQNRERVFIVGHLREEGGCQVLPFSGASGGFNEGASEMQVANALQSSGHACGNYRGMNMILQERCADEKGEGHSVRVFDGDVCPTLIGQMGTGGNNVPMILSHSPRTNDPKLGGSGPLLSSEHCFTIDSTPHTVFPCLTPNRPKKRQNGRRFKNDGEEMFTLTGQDQHGVLVDGEQPRKLTEIECEWLQGFPDGWTAGIAMSHRYHCLGNAVSVPVIKFLANLLLGDK
jgi:DNA (cytosine-5)-methyltransferase 1